MKFQLLFLSILTLFVSCHKNDKPVDENPVLEWKYGKNYFQVEIDGVQREFYIHIPDSYDKSNASALVFMFHGSSGTGERFYNISGWVEKSNQEGFIAVFPTALKYYVVDVGRKITKWSISNLNQQLPEGTQIVDDIPFIRKMVGDIKKSFNIDDKMIFASGFSNGGGFCKSRLLIEMSDVFAAYGTAGTWGLPYDLRYKHPENDVSVYNILGNKDPKILESLGRDEPLPMNVDLLYAIENGAFKFSSDNLVISMGFDTTFNAKYKLPYNMQIIYSQKSGIKVENELIFHVLKDLLHNYPTKDNNPAGLVAADAFWTFFLKHKKK